jgi:hypothetical protein
MKDKTYTDLIFHFFVFRRLADISRSTRGVIVLICNLQTAKQVTTEAQRLNMMSGHFVWLWIDTSASTSLVTPTNIPSPADNNTRSDPSNLNATFDSPTNPQQSARSRFSSSKRHDRELGDSRSQWVTSSSNNSAFVDIAFATSSPEETQPGIRKLRAAERTAKETPGSGQDMRTSDLFSTTKSGSGQMKSQRTSSDIPKASSQRESMISESDMSNIKDTFTSAASRGMGFISNSDESSTHYLKKILKASDSVEVLGQDRISDLVNFRETKLLQNARSAGNGWVYQENRNDISERFKIKLPGLSEEDTDQDVEGSLPVGLLAMRTQPMRLDRHLVKGAVRLMAETLLRVLTQCADWMPSPPSSNNSCWTTPSGSYQNFSNMFAR